MPEIGAINVLGCFVELSDGRSDAAGELDPNQQRQDFDQQEYSGDGPQNIFDALGVFSAIGKQTSCEHRRPSLDESERS